MAGPSSLTLSTLLAQHHVRAAAAHGVSLDDRWRAYDFDPRQLDDPEGHVPFALVSPVHPANKTANLFGGWPFSFSNVSPGVSRRLHSNAMTIVSIASAMVASHRTVVPTHPSRWTRRRKSQSLKRGVLLESRARGVPDMQTGLANRFRARRYRLRLQRWN